MTEQAEDITAIDRSITSAPVQTEAARQLRDDWIRWIDTRTAWQKNFDRPTFDEARNRRLDFFVANALTDAEKTEIRRQAAEGLSSEQVHGEPDRRQTGGTYTGASAGGWGEIAALGLGLATAGFLGGAYFTRRR